MFIFIYKARFRRYLERPGEVLALDPGKSTGVPSALGTFSQEFPLGKISLPRRRGLVCENFGKLTFSRRVHLSFIL